MENFDAISKAFNSFERLKDLMNDSNTQPNILVAISGLHRITEMLKDFDKNKGFEESKLNGLVSSIEESIDSLNKHVKPINEAIEELNAMKDTLNNEKRDE